MENIGRERADVPPYGHQEDFCVMNWKSTAEGSELARDTSPCRRFPSRGTCVLVHILAIVSVCPFWDNRY